MRPFRIAALAALALAGLVNAEESTPPREPTDQDRIEEVVVIGNSEDADIVAGAGTLIDQDLLERFDYVDLNQVLLSVPGVYVREEDGFGLRPNIGIRGASAERSQKVAIMEDGVLIAPAPYSAPAAYYVPSVSRIHSVEVLKGPAAIRHGPHTVGGAVNFVTRPVPDEALAEVDVSVGNHGFHKVQGACARPFDTSALLVEGMRYGSTGFKEIDGGGDTGFVRNALDAKWRLEPAGERDQILNVKLGYADEDADETYLGLTDQDFDRDPVRRYPASQLAHFQSAHTLTHVNYGVAVTRELHLNAKAYWNRFKREWNKVDGFLAGPTLQSVLARAGGSRQYQLLLGEIDSTRIEADTLDVTNNDRAFDVRGVQLTASLTRFIGDFEHSATAGVRLHRDEVERDHRQPRLSDGWPRFGVGWRCPGLENHQRGADGCLRRESGGRNRLRQLGARPLACATKTSVAASTICAPASAATATNPSSRPASAHTGRRRSDSACWPAPIAASLRPGPVRPMWTPSGA